MLEANLFPGKESGINKQSEFSLSIELIIFPGQSDCLFKLNQLITIQNTVILCETIAVMCKVMPSFLHPFLLLLYTFKYIVLIFPVTVF